MQVQENWTLFWQPEEMEHNKGSSTIYTHLRVPVSTMTEDFTRASAITFFFHDNVQKKKAAIGIKLNGVQPAPLREDRQFSWAPLHDLTEVTDDEVWKLLSSMRGKF